ncbi:MAG: phosphodiester glycosidase family protein [Capsulimonadaceae bacterium]
MWLALVAVGPAGCGSQSLPVGPAEAHFASVTDTAFAGAPAGDVLATGVTHHAVPTDGLDIIDVDLRAANVRIAVGSRHIHNDGGAIVADPVSPADWVGGGALAAINGGYFGAAHGQACEVVGLLVEDGRVRHAAPPLRGSGGSGLAAGSYVRSAFGMMPDGQPHITWAATAPSHSQRVLAFTAPSPVSPPTTRAGRPWAPREAIGCGPMLITHGRPSESERRERLVSDGPLPRTFVAYDNVGGRPQHIVLGISSGATFDELRQEVLDYFPKFDGTHAWAAMCFDGGSSAQMSYRANGDVVSPRTTGVKVADCLLVFGGRQGAVAP